MAMTQPNSDAMKKIFSSIMSGHLAPNGNAEVMGCTKPIVDSTVDLFFSVLRDLKPIPAKSHYTFNLRDVSKVIQGVLMMKATAIPSKEILTRLWCHEALRVFCDRLIDNDDREYFRTLISDYVKAQFKLPWTKEELFEGENKLVFGDYMRTNPNPHPHPHPHPHPNPIPKRNQATTCAWACLERIAGKRTWHPDPHLILTLTLTLTRTRTRTLNPNPLT